MATLTLTGTPRQALSPGLILWLTASGMLTALLVALSLAVRNNTTPVQDQAVMDWVLGWNLPGLAMYFDAISLLTNTLAGLVFGLVGMTVFLLLRKTRAALAFAIVGGLVALVAIFGDSTLGEALGRTRPLDDNPVPSFPSGHVFGSTIFFGFWGFLAVHYRLRIALLVPLMILFAGLIASVGPARIYEQAHWPSDVAAGYMLGVLWLLVVIPVFLRLRPIAFGSSTEKENDRSAINPAGYRIERSIASTVMLDPQQGTATKIYRAPALVRMLYWIAFQAKFPYESNTAALQASKYRRKIAGLLTTHVFGSDLVAPVVEVRSVNGQYALVTQFVPGDKVLNDGATKRFLAQVAETFAQAGLSVWQIDPRNPHAHTNLIRTPEGEMKIIDLESAIVTPLPARGQWWSAMKSGNFPVFDDIDFPRLRRYIDENRADLARTLGPTGIAELVEAVAQGERTIRSWKDGEPRIWGRLLSRIYRTLDWSAICSRVAAASAAADRAAAAFLAAGIQRWENEGKLGPLEARELRGRLSSVELQDAMHHLGAHLAITVIFRFPFGSPVRFAWTAFFWGKAQIIRRRHSSTAPNRDLANIHTPVVMALSLVPGLGGISYLAARPLRQKLLIRLVLDQIALKLPFRVYERAGLGRWLAPAPKPSERQKDTSETYVPLRGATPVGTEQVGLAD